MIQTQYNKTNVFTKCLFSFDPEAGKIALNQFIQQEAEIGVVGENGEMGEVTEEDAAGVLGEQMTEESIVEHAGETGLTEGEEVGLDNFFN